MKKLEKWWTIRLMLENGQKFVKFWKKKKVDILDSDEKVPKTTKNPEKVKKNAKNVANVEKFGKNVEKVKNLKRKIGKSIKIE